MRPSRYLLLRDHFQALLDLEAAARPAALEALAAQDPSLAAEVQRLLDEDARHGQSTWGDAEVTMGVAVAQAAERYLGELRPLSPGDHVGRYEAVRRLGVGGMAEVWAVRHVQLGTWHALKVLLNASEAMRERLLQEGMAQARLHHPNIVPVRDVLSVDGVPALLMPLIEGPSLGALLREGPLSGGDALRLLKGIVAGVAHAHDLGLIHRDLKPDNVLLDLQAGQLVPRVADFGLVKLAAGPRTTRADAVMGTPAFAAPEQLSDARGVDARADLFSLGVLIVRLFTGHLPFHGDSLEEIRAAHHQPPDLHGLAPALRPLVERLLRREPDERLDSARALALALDALPEEGAATSADLFERAFAQRVSQVLTPSPGGTRPTEPIRDVHGLPPARDRFIGRVLEVDGLLRRLDEAGRADPGRLFTLTGAGGTGKTRLAQQVARCLGGDWDSAWWVDLSDARDLEGIYAAVAGALGVDAGADPARRVAHALRARGRCLVLLDNFEQLVAHAPATLGAWLDATREAVFIVTSRMPLRLRGEQRVPVEPLDPESARELYLSRARSTGADLEALQAGPLDALLERLDHLPLALELAAARADRQPPGLLLTLLEARVARLEEEGDDRPARQRTLQATLDWSWSLLSPTEQRVLAALSIFEGGFDPDAVAAVLEPGEPELFVDPVIDALLDHGLLHRDRLRVGQRLRMLVSIQEYAAARLPEVREDQAELIARHAQHHARLGAPLLGRLPARGQYGASAPNVAHLDNLIAVVQRLPVHQDGEATGLAALAAGAILSTQGPYARWASLTSDALEAPMSPVLRATLLGCRAAVLGHLERRDEALAAADEALSLTAQGPLELHVDLLIFKGSYITNYLYRPEEALPILQRAHALLPSQNTLLRLGEQAYVSGERSAARRWYTQALEEARRQGDDTQLAFALYMLGYLLRTEGEIADALRLLREGRSLAMKVGNKMLAGQLLTQEAYGHSASGDVDAALELAGDAARILDAIGDARRADHARSALAEALYTCGRFEEAGALFRELGDRAGAQGRRTEHLRETVNLGLLRALQGRHAESRRLLDRAEALNEDPVIPLFVHVIPLMRAWALTEAGAGAEALAQLAPLAQLRIERALRLRLLADHVEAVALRLVGRLSEAEQRSARTLQAVTEQLGDARLRGACELELGRVWRAQGEAPARVDAVLGAAERSFVETGQRHLQLVALAERALLPGGAPEPALDRARALLEKVDSTPILELTMAKLGRAARA